MESNYRRCQFLGRPCSLRVGSLMVVDVKTISNYFEYAALSDQEGD